MGWSLLAGDPAEEEVEEESGGDGSECEDGDYDECADGGGEFPGVVVHHCSFAGGAGRGCQWVTASHSSVPNSCVQPMPSSLSPMSTLRPS